MLNHFISIKIIYLNIKNIFISIKKFVLFLNRSNRNIFPNRGIKNNVASTSPIITVVIVLCACYTNHHFCHYKLARTYFRVNLAISEKIIKVQALTSKTTKDWKVWE